MKKSAGGLEAEAGTGQNPGGGPGGEDPESSAYLSLKSQCNVLIISHNSLSSCIRAAFLPLCAFFLGQIDCNKEKYSNNKLNF